MNEDPTHQPHSALHFLCEFALSSCLKKWFSTTEICKGIQDAVAQEHEHLWNVYVAIINCLLSENVKFRLNWLLFINKGWSGKPMIFFVNNSVNNAALHQNTHSWAYSTHHIWISQNKPKIGTIHEMWVLQKLIFDILSIGLDRNWCISIFLCHK